MTHHWPVIGHDWAVNHLRKGIANRRIRHAYLITGVESVGKTTLAHALAMALNCTHEDLDARPCGVCRSCRMVMSGNHPDMIYAEAESASGALKVDEVRGITGRLTLRPYEARYRIALLPDFDLARPIAQDALLKTLEEPPGHAILLLLASSMQAILPTITSRAQALNLRPVAVDTVRETLIELHGVEPDDAEVLARLSGGRLGWAIRAAQEPEVLDQRSQALDLLEDVIGMNRKGRFDVAEAIAKDKPALGPLLDLWLTYWRDLLLLVSNSPVKPCNVDRQVSLEQLAYAVGPEEARAAMSATRTMLGHLHWNVNVRLALETMFLDYPGLMS